MLLTLFGTTGRDVRHDVRGFYSVASISCRLGCRECRGVWGGTVLCQCGLGCMAKPPTVAEVTLEAP